MKHLISRSLLLLVLLVVSAGAAMAQNPIRWRMTVKMTSATEGVATLRAVVAPGWHLYGFDLPEDGPRPTAINFDKSEGVVLKGALTPARKPLSVDDPMFGVRLSWWDADVTFTQKFKIKKGTTPRLEATVSYMGCNDQTCLPPKTESLVFTSFSK
ncbi:MAG: protein-disulfide reductase DsbD N-terminal domain-containing protein [Muribaculaceae bacterium]|nr:protein-disulfide reductase DsbD N-terminal domain-containing protein [Muribaculaceae bacterium]